MTTIGGGPLQYQRVQGTQQQIQQAQTVRTDDNVVKNDGGVLNKADVQGALDSGATEMFIQTGDGATDFLRVDLSTEEGRAYMQDILNNMEDCGVECMDLLRAPDEEQTLSDGRRTGRDLRREFDVNLRDGLDPAEADRIFTQLMNEGATQDEINAVVDKINSKIDNEDQQLTATLREDGGIDYELTDDTTETTRGRLQRTGEFDIDISLPRFEQTREGHFDVGLGMEVGMGEEHTITIRRSTEQIAEDIDFSEHFSLNEQTGEYNVNDRGQLRRDLKKVGINIRNGVSEAEFNAMKEHFMADGASEYEAGQMIAAIQSEYDMRVSELKLDCDNQFVSSNDDDEVNTHDGAEINFRLPNISFDPHADIQLPQFEYVPGDIDIELPSWERETTTTEETGFDGQVDPTIEEVHIQEDCLEDPINPEDAPLILREDFDASVHGRFEHDNDVDRQDAGTPVADVNDYLGDVPDNVTMTLSGGSNLLHTTDHNLELTEDRIGDFGERFNRDEESIGELKHQQYIDEHFGLEETSDTAGTSHLNLAYTDGREDDNFLNAAEGLFTAPIGETGRNILQSDDNIAIQNPDGSYSPADTPAGEAMQEYIDGLDPALSGDEVNQLLDYAQSYVEHRGYDIEMDISIANQEDANAIAGWLEGKERPADNQPELQQAYDAMQGSLDSWNAQVESTNTFLQGFQDNVTTLSTAEDHQRTPETLSSFQDALQSAIEQIMAAPGESITMSREMAESLGVPYDGEGSNVTVGKNTLTVMMTNMVMQTFEDN